MKVIQQSIKVLSNNVFKRSFYMWINFVFNRVDRQRIEQFGPDRVAAEWVLRNGGSVKFLQQNNWIRNYNALDMGPTDKFKLQKIDGKETCLTNGGLEHLVGLKHLDHLNLHGCKYVSDVKSILQVKDSLVELDLSSCPLGDIAPLSQFRMLKRLNLSGVTRLKNRKDTIENLQQSLPQCEILYK